MRKIHWKIELENEEKFTGSCELGTGSLRIFADLPDCTLKSVLAKIRMPLSDEGFFFVNGFQSWTDSREYSKKEKLRGLNAAPAALVEKYSLDRYGDYHFTKYPYKKGLFHSFSYCYFREGDRYFFIGSTDEINGYTIFKYDANRGVLLIKRDCEGLMASGRFAAFDLYIAEGTEDEVFDGYFEAMRCRCLSDGPICGYSSWYNRYQNIDIDCISEDLEGAGNVLYPGDLFQIDDGWEPFVGDWLEADPEKFPDGMKAAADAIHEKGLKAGLWLAPFVAEEDSDIYKLHPDWFLKTPAKRSKRLGVKEAPYAGVVMSPEDDGDPWKAGCNWSGFYALDIDNPEVIKYITEVFRRIREDWGYDLVKLDFLYAAAPFGSAAETRAARMIRATNLLRKLCGKMAILGCGIPLWPAFGKVEYCRVSCDVTLNWDNKLYMQIAHRERDSTKHAISTDRARRHLNGRAFGNDPDVFSLRTKNLSLTDEQKAEFIRMSAECGNVFLTSDNMSDYTESQIRVYEYYRKKLMKRFQK